MTVTTSSAGLVLLHWSLPGRRWPAGTGPDRTGPDRTGPDRTGPRCLQVAFRPLAHRLPRRTRMAWWHPR
jgi:hypothetical protein